LRRKYKETTRMDKQYYLEMNECIAMTSSYIDCCLSSPYSDYVEGYIAGDPRRLPKTLPKRLPKTLSKRLLK
jgi:hypothetical protein